MQFDEYVVYPIFCFQIIFFEDLDANHMQLSGPNLIPKITETREMFAKYHKTD